jgi:predicted phosphate transport protein (TIGR00153 family)
MNSIFKRSVELNMKIEKFLEVISQSLLLFEKAIKEMLKDDTVLFNETLSRICRLETEADELENEIKVMLYKYLLLPDARADVLSLIKSLDDIIDAIEAITKDFGIQKPKFPDVLHEGILQMTHSSVESAESLLLATRAFFSEVHLVTAHISKVRFFEHETDIMEDKINMSIFNDDLLDQLAEKMQLKYFISKVASIEDIAEIISEKLKIFTIKREI